MIETSIILTRAEFDAWVRERKQWDRDFTPDVPPLPALIVYTETESNGYPRIEWSEFTAVELLHLHSGLT